MNSEALKIDSNPLYKRQQSDADKNRRKEIIALSLTGSAQFILQRNGSQEADLFDASFALVKVAGMIADAVIEREKND